MAEGTAGPAVGALMALIDEVQWLVADLRALRPNSGGMRIAQVVEQRDVDELQACLVRSASASERVTPRVVQDPGTLQGRRLVSPLTAWIEASRRSQSVETEAVGKSSCDGISALAQ